MQEQANITQEKIFELYGDYLLHHGEKPKNVYLFAKENDFEEKAEARNQHTPVPSQEGKTQMCRQVRGILHSAGYVQNDK